MVSFRSFHSAHYCVFAATWGICSRSFRPPNAAFTQGFDTVLIRSLERKVINNWSVFIRY